MKVFWFLVLLVSITGFSQSRLSGSVYSAKDSTALEAVSIYFDGTTIGTITNKEGHFTLTIEAGIKSPLVISMIGYAPVYVSDYFNTNGRIPAIYLIENTEQLDAVYLENDDWSRKRKLNVFRKEFLGNSPEALQCKILNEDVIRLHYSKSNMQLTAWSNTPLIIRNNYLGYTVQYTLTDFSVDYEQSLTSGIQYVTLVYSEGFTFYKELKNRTRSKYLKNRAASYSGSTLHFMRSLSQERLTENKFKIFYKSYEVAPYSRFKLKKEEGLMFVELLAEKLTILYDDEEQSFIQTNRPFVIDAFGNHSPATAITMGGVMSERRLAFLLPLDYKL
ncbi:carboxypeptidase-like regulatory domain-containing protein [Leeuwenhoekiella sp. NPDC079379]|uniref:carboxypeptidase-like regulatory domain-containing protein n=1 Tax=Leeuwenhoekiella sp. NPDC079379 TaxID=3364122 RepID=UPI0037CCA934